MTDSEQRPGLNVWRVALVLTLLPAVLGVERWAYWMSRGVLFMHLRDIGVAPGSVGTIMTAQVLANTLLVVLGGVVAIAAGPVLPLISGVAISVVGYALIAASDGTAMVWIGMAVLGLGQGLSKPAFFAVAAAELAHPREQLRALAFVLLYAVLNASALTSSTAAGVVTARMGATAVFVTAAGAAAVGAVLAAGLGVAWFFTRRGAVTAPSPLRTGRVLWGALGLIALAAPYVAQLTLVSSLSFDAAASGSLSWLTMINPVAVILGSCLVMGVLVVLHLRQVELPALLVVAAGLCLAGLSAVPLMLARTSVWAAVASEGTLGLAEVLVGPFAMARVIGDVPRRFQALVMSAWFVVSGGVPVLVSFFSRRFPRAEIFLLAAAALGVFVLGAVLLFTAKALSRWLYEPASADA
ncbi:MAG: hypothetical protein IT377_06385 [Polyangiaceae bacterium]|nr:hypothetical protein [Polyangiaceae bacterium]